MSHLERSALWYWSAALYYRRAVDRNTRSAIRVLKSISRTAPPAVKQRANQLLRQIHGK